MKKASTNPGTIAHDVVATIPEDENTSGALNLHGNTLSGIHMPASFQGSNLTFLAASTEDGTYQEVFRNGSALTIPIDQAKYIGVDPTDFVGIQYLKIKSDATETAGAALTLAVRHF